MTLPNGTTITLGQVNAEMSRPYTQQISMNDQELRNLFGVPTPNSFNAMSYGWGKSSHLDIGPVYASAATYASQSQQCPLTLGAPVYPGDLIAIGSQSVTGHGTGELVLIQSISDAGGNGYSLLSRITPWYGYYAPVEMWATISGVYMPTGSVIYVNYNTPDELFAVAVVAGGISPSPYDAYNLTGQNGNGTSLSIGTPWLAQNNELVLGFVSCGSAGWPGGGYNGAPGFTNLHQFYSSYGAGNTAFDYAIVRSNAPVTWSPSFHNDPGFGLGPTVGAMATFKGKTANREVSDDDGRKNIPDPGDASHHDLQFADAARASAERAGTTQAADTNGKEGQPAARDKMNGH